MNMLKPLPPPAAKDEVRQCAKCHEPAVVLVFEWKHTYGGADSRYSTRDYRCQACGAKFSLHPRIGSWTFVALGILMSPAIFPLGFTLFGWMRLRRDGANPVMPNAPRPQLKYRDGPPVRKCVTCGNPVALTRVTRHTSRGIPTGTEYEYACGPCKKEFTIESAWGHTFSLMGGALVVSLGLAFLLTAQSPGWKYGGGGAMTLLAVFLIGQTGVRVSNRFRYPVVDEKA
jgi:DNA-directed RNA polymerase subunit RPC12/RpoP